MSYAKSSAPPSGGSPRWVGVALALILLFGAGLRVWYALPEPNKARFWDERYSLENVEAVLGSWSLRPARGYYPAPLQSWPQALALAASQKLGELTGIEWLETVTERGRFTPTAYLLVRSISVVYGVLALLVLFLLGRRMVSAEIGLLAALGLAATPWHIHVSGKFKPDALLVLAVLLGFYWSIRAIEGGRRRDYALAGLGITLAASAKLLGVLVAVPLAVGSLWLATRERVRVGRLALAAATSVGTFFLLNPYGLSYLWYVRSLQDDYAKRAEWSGMTRATMPEELGEYFFGPTVHGPLLATVAILGLVGLLIRAARPGRLELERRVGIGMLVAFPLVYAGAYLAATPYFKGNNLLPIVPFTTLAALWLVVTVWRGLSERLAPARRLTPVAVALLVVALAAPGWIYTYRSLTPTTLDIALRFLRRGVGSPDGRIVFVEEVEIGEPRWERWEPFGRTSVDLTVERLDRVAERRLARADGEIFPEERLQGDRAAFYRSRMERVSKGRLRRIRPRWFELRGPALVVIRHWRRGAGGWIDVPMERCSAGEHLCITGQVPERIRSRALVSLTVRVPAGVVGEHPLPSAIRVGGRSVPLRIAKKGRRVLLFLTERFPLARAPAEIRLETEYPPQDDARLRLAIRQWGASGSEAPEPESSSAGSPTEAPLDSPAESSDAFRDREGGPPRELVRLARRGGDQTWRWTSSREDSIRASPSTRATVRPGSQQGKRSLTRLNHCGRESTR
ncbi:MAG: glycosyltransferase family 39 protein [Thermoanaerobaculia bacterium]|nr:glycosyltransferase family 39 protein [Thermoanaerobaculia bacterium]